MGDFGSVRDLLWDLQEMARIGNWLTTWEREIEEGDYTADIVVAALEEGIVTPRELRRSESDAIETIKNHDIEERFRRRWRERYRAVRNREFDADSVDLDALVGGWRPSSSTTWRAAATSGSGVTRWYRRTRGVADRQQTGVTRRSPCGVAGRRTHLSSR